MNNTINMRVESERFGRGKPAKNNLVIKIICKMSNTSKKMKHAPVIN